MSTQILSTKICTQMFIAAQFITAKTGKHLHNFLPMETAQNLYNVREIKTMQEKVLTKPRVDFQLQQNAYIYNMKHTPQNFNFLEKDYHPFCNTS